LTSEETAMPVEPLNLTVSDPSTQSELQAVANKLEELIAALRR